MTSLVSVSVNPINSTALFHKVPQWKRMCPMDNSRDQDGISERESSSRLSLLWIILLKWKQCCPHVPEYLIPLAQVERALGTSACPIWFLCARCPCTTKPPRSQKAAVASHSTSHFPLRPFNQSMTCARGMSQSWVSHHSKSQCYLLLNFQAKTYLLHRWAVRSMFPIKGAVN